MSCPGGYTGDACTTINCGEYGSNQPGNASLCTCEYHYRPIYEPVSDTLPVCRRYCEDPVYESTCICSPSYGVTGALCDQPVDASAGGFRFFIPLVVALLPFFVCVCLSALVYSCWKKYRLDYYKAKAQQNGDTERVREIEAEQGRRKMERAQKKAEKERNAAEKERRRLVKTNEQLQRQARKEARDAQRLV